MTNSRATVRRAFVGAPMERVGNLGAGHRLRLGIVNALLVACFRIQLRYSMCFCVVVSDLLDCAQHKNLADFLLAGVTHESVAERFTNTAEEVVAFLLCEVLLVALKFADGIDHDPAIVEDRDSAGGTRILVREEESGNLGNPFLPFPDETTLTMSTGSLVPCGLYGVGRAHCDEHPRGLRL